MLWRVLIVCGLLNFGAHVAFADNEVGLSDAPESMGESVEVEAEPAIVNDVPNAQQEAKDIIDVLNPTIEAVYNVEAGAWQVGTSASLYDFKSNNIHLGRIKAGYLSANAFYGGVDVDVPGLVSRYVGGRWSQLDAILDQLSKYGSTGYIVGYDVDAEDVVHGPTFGATLRF